jgi:hypothetical protein
MSMSMLMMHRFVLFAFTVAAGAAVACAPEATTPHDGGGGAGGGGSGAVTYTKDVKPILAAKCMPCHTTEGAGNPPHNIGTTYADFSKVVVTPDAPAACFKDGLDKMMGKTIGECVVPVIMEGWMPMGQPCFMTPRPAACVSLDEQAIIEAWVAAGLPQ